jgi:hypothetical protein
MSIQSNIIITKHFNRVLIALVTVATLVFAAAPMFAHGGFDHVMGTVVKVADNVLTVKTAKGNVEVKLDDKTELTQNSQKAQLTDLTPGARVVVDIPEGNKDKIAHSVKIGTAGKAVSHK